MYALVGRVEIKPGHEDETAMMARDHGPSLVGGMPGNKLAYWARALDDRGKVIQHSFWLFETEEDARAAEKMFSSLREMPEAPAGFVNADVCEVIAQM
jgi:hypothetical protein